MLQSEVQTAARAAHLDGLGQAALQALAAGATRDEVMTTLSAVIDDYQARQLPLLAMSPCDGQELIYDELPDGMIDLPAAAQRFNLPTATLHTWLRKSHINSYGRRRASAPGGGTIVLNEAEIAAYIEAPKPKGGRPRKKT